MVCDITLDGNKDAIDWSKAGVGGNAYGIFT